MNPFSFPILSVITFLPLAGAGILLLIPKQNLSALRNIAFITALVNFFISLLLFSHFNIAHADMQFVELKPWIPDFGVSYHMGMDGISLFLILLTTLLSAIA